MKNKDESGREEAVYAGKRAIYSEIARQSGVAEDDVRKVMEVLGINNHFDEVTELIGASPNFKDLLLGFHLSKSGVAV